MPRATSTYFYRAIGPQGIVGVGEISAASAAAAAAALVRTGHRPLRVQTRPIRDGLLHREIGLPRSRRISLAEARSFSRDLSIMLESSLELHRAIELVAAALPERSTLAKFVRSVHQGLSFGRGFAESARLTGYQLPADFLPTLIAAEASGGLPRAFAMLAASYEQRLDLRQKLIGAAAYPAFLIVAALASLAIIATFVAPSLAGLFTSLDRPLPLAIKVLVEIPGAMQRHSALLAAGSALVVVAVVVSVQVRQTREIARAAVFGLPWLGSLFVWAATSRFAGVLHLAALNNVPIADAVASAWGASGFPFASSRAPIFADDIRRGRRLQDAAQSLPYLPPAAVRLLAAGEATNRLPLVLSTIVHEAERQVAHRATILTNLMAPALIVLVGGLVGTLVFSVFSALLEVSRLTY